MRSGATWPTGCSCRTSAGCLTAVRPCAKTAEREGQGTPGDCLVRAASSGNVLLVQLLEQPRDPNETDMAWTPLQSAAARGYSDTVQFLLQVGADKDKADNEGCTPLIMSVEQSHEAVVHCLLAAGADKRKANNRGATPLHIGACQGRDAIVLYLLEAGADKNMADHKGRTAAGCIYGNCLLEAGTGTAGGVKPSARGGSETIMLEAAKDRVSERWQFH